jgi:hypothetical protein
MPLSFCLLAPVPAVAAFSSPCTAPPPRSGPCRSPCTDASCARAGSGPSRSPCTRDSGARAGSGPRHCILRMSLPFCLLAPVLAAAAFSSPCTAPSGARAAWQWPVPQSLHTCFGRPCWQWPVPQSLHTLRLPSPRACLQWPVPACHSATVPAPLLPAPVLALPWGLIRSPVHLLLQNP